MNKKLVIVLSITIFLMIAIFAISYFLIYGTQKMRKKGPKEWYGTTRDIYIQNFKEGWTNENPDIRPLEDYKDKSKKFGYYLVDLNDDGTLEFLVGFDNGTKATVFTDVYIWHKDFGPTRILNGGVDLYYYLCTDKSIKEDLDWGKNSETRFMKYNKEENSFTIIEKGGEPMKVELTYFE